MAEQLKPGDYTGLYIDDVLICTGVLKDQVVMEYARLKRRTACLPWRSRKTKRWLGL